MSVLDLDWETLPDSDALPPGEYTLRIDKVSEIQLDKRQNQYLGFEYSVIEGEYVNRKVFDPYVPLQGRSTLKKILRATKFPQQRLGNSDQLIGLTFKAVLRVEKTEEYGEQNRIVAYIDPDNRQSMDMSAPPVGAGAAKAGARKGR